jgi:hypothetical protein
LWKTTQNSVGCCCITGPPMQRRSPRRREEEFPSSGATDDQSRTFCGRCEMSSKFKTGQAVEYCGLIAPLGPYVIAPFCRNEMASLRHPNEAHARAARESGPPPGWGHFGDSRRFPKPPYSWREHYSGTPPTAWCRKGDYTSLTPRDHAEIDGVALWG